MSEHTAFGGIPGAPGPAPSGSVLRPVWLAVSFALFLYVGWMLLAGLWAPRGDWFSAGGERVQTLLYYLSLDGFALALSAGFLCGLEGRRFRDLGLSPDSGWLRQIGAGLVWGAGVICGAVFVLFVFRAAVISIYGTRSLARLGFLALFLCFSSVFEELTFRGYALQRLAGALGPAAGVLVTSAIFGLAHYANPQATLLSTFNTMLAGALLAIARLRTRALWMPISLHFAWNFLLGPVFSFPVSGYTFGAQLLSSPAAAPQWLSGGAYGPEASVALTVSAAVAIPLLLLFPLPASSLDRDSGVH